MLDFTTTSIFMETVAGPMSAVGVILLVALLIHKEIVNGSSSGRAKRLSQALNIGIVPLLFVFILVLFLKALEIYR